MIPRDGNDATFARDVRQILRAAEVGLRWADNIGPTAVLQSFLAASAPYSIAPGLPASPTSVIVLRAVNRTTNAIESGCRVTWTWGRGSVVVSAVDVGTPANEYDITFGLLMG